MNNISTPEYTAFLEALLRVEGKTIEDELEFGCLALEKETKKIFIFADRFSIQEYNIEFPFSFNYKDRDSDFLILGQPIYAHRLLAGLGKKYEWVRTLMLNGESFLTASEYSGSVEEAEETRIPIDFFLPIHQHSIEVITKLTELLTQPE